MSLGGWRAKLSGEVGTTVWAFAATAIIKLGSSIVLTRLLFPEAYGVATMVISVLITLEMLSDLGFQVLVVRHPDIEAPRFLQTAWTLRFLRSIVNALILWFAAPSLAVFFGAHEHVAELRLACLYVLFAGVESFGFLLATRHQQSRYQSMTELGATAIATIFSIVWSYHDRSPWGLVAGMLVQRAIVAVGSYTVVKRHRSLRFVLDAEHLRTIFRMARAVMPASLVTLVLGQLDKLVIARLLPLSAVGLYGIGQNMAGMAASMSERLGSSVLLPRYAALARSGPPADPSQPYRQTRTASLIMLGSPLILAGLSDAVIDRLYDPRYAGAGIVVTALCVRTFIVNYATTATQLLLAYGYDRVHGIPPFLRIAALVTTAWPGYHLLGFRGLLLAIAVEPLSAVAYAKHLQYRKGLLHIPSELRLLVFSGLVFAVSALLGSHLDR